MKSVLISTRPKLVEKICHKIGEDETGKAIYEKRIEVRKTAPQEVPFKAYIYCTKGKPYLYRVDDDDNFELTNTLRPKVDGYVKDYNEQNGKVIGEFICDRIICSQAYFDSQGKNHLTNVFPDDIKKTCLDEYDLWDYIAGKAVKANQMYDGYLWHISDLKIYDKPRELSEFSRPCSYSGLCFSCKRTSFKKDGNLLCNTKITRPPQSWCYVEDLGEEE